MWQLWQKEALSRRETSPELHDWPWLAVRLRWPGSPIDVDIWRMGLSEGCTHGVLLDQVMQSLMTLVT